MSLLRLDLGYLTYPGVSHILCSDATCNLRHKEAAIVLWLVEVQQLLLSILPGLLLPPLHHHNTLRVDMQDMHMATSIAPFE